jgi:hypothetical protein
MFLWGGKKLSLYRDILWDNRRQMTMDNLQHLDCELQENRSWKLGELNVSTTSFLTYNEKMLALLHDLYLCIAFHCKWIIQWLHKINLNVDLLVLK